MISALHDCLCSNQVLGRRPRIVTHSRCCSRSSARKGRRHIHPRHLRPRVSVCSQRKWCHYMLPEHCHTGGITACGASSPANPVRTEENPNSATTAFTDSAACSVMPPAIKMGRTHARTCSGIHQCNNDASRRVARPCRRNGAGHGAVRASVRAAKPPVTICSVGGCCRDLSLHRVQTAPRCRATLPASPPPPHWASSQSTNVRSSCPHRAVRTWRRTCRLRSFPRPPQCRLRPPTSS